MTRRASRHMCYVSTGVTVERAIHHPRAYCSRTGSKQCHRRAALLRAMHIASIRHSRLCTACKLLIALLLIRLQSTRVFCCVGAHIIEPGWHDAGDTDACNSAPDLSCRCFSLSVSLTILYLSLRVRASVSGRSLRHRY